MVVIVAHGDLAALASLKLNAGELWIAGSALCWGLYTVLLKRQKFESERLPLLVMLLGLGAVAALPFYFWELAHDERSALDGNGLLALAYVAAPGGALMYYLYNRSVDTLGASRAGLMLYLQTAFVALLAYLFLGEGLHAYDLDGRGHHRRRPGDRHDDEAEGAGPISQAVTVFDPGNDRRNECRRNTRPNAPAAR